MPDRSPEAACGERVYRLVLLDRRGGVRVDGLTQLASAPATGDGVRHRDLLWRVVDVDGDEVMLDPWR